MLDDIIGFAHDRVRASTLYFCSILGLLAGLIARVPDGRAQNTEPGYRNRTVPQWIKVLQTADAPGRAEAAYCLGQIGPKAESAVTILQGIAQKDSDNFVRAEAVYALGKIGPAARSALPSFLLLIKGDSNSGVRGAVATALGTMGCDSDQSVPMLIAALKGDKSAYVRGCAALALGHLGVGARAALPSLIVQTARNARKC